MPRPNPNRISKYDDQILEHLRKNPTASNSEVAEAVGCHYRTASDSVSRHEEKNRLILEYRRPNKAGENPRRALAMADVLDLANECRAEGRALDVHRISEEFGVRMDTAYKAWRLTVEVSS